MVLPKNVDRRGYSSICAMPGPAFYDILVHKKSPQWISLTYCTVYVLFFKLLLPLTVTLFKIADINLPQSAKIFPDCQVIYLKNRVIYLDYQIFTLTIG
jgi:hypothetical protein